MYAGKYVDKQKARRIADLIMYRMAPKLGTNITDTYIHVRLGANGATVHGPKHEKYQNSKKRKTAPNNSILTCCWKSYLFGTNVRGLL